MSRPAAFWGGSEIWSLADVKPDRQGPRDQRKQGDERRLLLDSGLFDAAWYLQENADVAVRGVDPAAHYLDPGWTEGRWPNPCFDPGFYLRGNPEVARSGANPLLHYIAAGEREHRAPVPFFDVAWYGGQHCPEPGRTLLAHYLRHRTDGGLSPMPGFDVAFYLERYPDVAAAGVDPFTHFLLYGYKEGRDPSAEFDTTYYLRRYLDGDTAENPLVHYHRHRGTIRLLPKPPPAPTDVFAQVRRFSSPGPAFEEVQALPRSARRRARVLAFYLPQFHEIAENNAWWGRGFTEWTALKRGMPRFVDHYQPRAPRDLGHYSLAPGADGRANAVMRRQIELALGAGLSGFVQYYYWFDRRRLLEAPLEAFLADPDLDFPFALMWANENWTRRWDGSEQDVLIAQHYNPADDAALVDDLARHFRDPRYIRLGGRPLLMVYRADAIPDTAATVARWRRLFAERHGEQVLLVMSQSFGATDPRPAGFDAAVEFPPHKLAVRLPRRNAELSYLDPHASGHVYAYDDVVAASLGEPATDFPLIKTAVPSWDNDARRQGHGLVLHASTPSKYQAWLSALVDRAVASPVAGEPIVCVNAWNEWAEGAYLEPDVHFGAAYLNATARAVGATATIAARRLLLVGHDAFPAGAQLLLLHLAAALRRGFGVQAEYLLLGGGTLEAEYAATLPGRVLPAADREAALDGLLRDYVARGFTAAVVNTSAAAWIVPRLRAAGIAPLLLVHEMPRLIHERGLGGDLRAAEAAATALVFPAASVRDRVAELQPLAPERTRIRPQGSYRLPEFSPSARAELRAELGIGADAPLVLGCGYADLRKGFDLFLQAWRATRRRRPDAMFVWVGAMDPQLRNFLGPEIAAATATGGFRLPGFCADVAGWYSAADVLALTSREDPFPSTVLEALGAGLPSVAFDEAGGIPELLREEHCGRAVALGDPEAMAVALLAQVAETPALRVRLAALARRRFDFTAYAEWVLHAADPELAPISVAVPSYNYARFMPARLASIFGQSHPVAEVLVLDDASTDDSVAVCHQVAADWGRQVTVLAAAANSGSVFAQWRRAAELARGDYLWIAEADDEAEPELLARLAGAIAAAPDIDLAFADSRAIDADGAPVSASYRDYYVRSGAAELAGSGYFPAAAFARRFLAERNLILNVSAVLWRREALLAALDRCGEELSGYRLAGDWRLYVELMAASQGQVAYVAEPLNVHRRHPQGVTGSLDVDSHLAEIARVQRAIRRRLRLDDAAARQQDAYLDEVARQLR